MHHKNICLQVIDLLNEYLYALYCLIFFEFNFSDICIITFKATRYSSFGKKDKTFS